jgi:hypothetical protein
MDDDENPVWLKAKEAGPVWQRVPNESIRLHLLGFVTYGRDVQGLHHREADACPTRQQPVSHWHQPVNGASVVLCSTQS